MMARFRLLRIVFLLSNKQCESAEVMLDVLLKKYDPEKIRQAVLKAKSPDAPTAQ